MRATLTVFLLSLAGILCALAGEPTSPRPNIIVIMCDDAGYADFGFMGGVAQTPNLDRLATEGVVLTNARNNGRCWPTRQSFITGLNPQLVHDWDRLGANCVTLPEVLNSAGYDSYMIGKWHLGMGTIEGNAPLNTPLGRGFKTFFGSLAGAVEVNKPNYIKHIKGFQEQGKTPMYLYDGDRIVQPEDMADDYYETFDWSDRGAAIIRNQPKDKPFFLFMSYTAPHWNLDPLAEYLSKYEGAFEGDWEEMRQGILNRQIERGISPKDCPLMPLPDKLKEYLANENTHQRAGRLKDIITYYASITEMDEGIQRLVEALKETGRERDTLILFFSDNGGEALGIPTAYRGMISNTPFGGFKVSSWEGGLATPLLAWWPGTIPAGKLNAEHEVHMEDFMPTFLELSGAQYPREVDGRPIYPYQGRSFVEAMKNPNSAGPRRIWAWEHDESCGVWSYPWKAVFLSPTHPLVRRGIYNPNQVGWRLFKLDKHRVEKDDLSQAEPDKLAEMVALWKEWAKSVGLRGLIDSRKATLPPEHEDAPRPNPATWSPSDSPLGRPPKSE